MCKVNVSDKSKWLDLAQTHDSPPDTGPTTTLFPSEPRAYYIIPFISMLVRIATIVTYSM